MPRQQKIKVPTTTQSTIIFPGKGWSRKFDTSLYNPSQTEGRVTLEELKEVLEQMETIQKPYRRWILFFRILYFILAIFGAVLTRIGIYNSYTQRYECIDGYCYWVNETNTGLLIGSIVGGFFGVLLLTFIYFVIYFLIIARSKIPAQALFNRINPNFTTRGLKWRLPTHFPLWIELTKLNTNNTQPIGEPLYLPPPMTQQYQNYPDIPGGMNQPIYNQQNQPIYDQQNQPIYNQQNFADYSANQA